jgi:5-methyltetrahydrofolate--homocysteine methyltransferase
MTDYNNLMEAVLNGDTVKVTELVRAAIDAGKNANAIMNEALIGGMNIVGEKMAKEEMFIPEVLMSAKAMSAGVDILKPLLTVEEQNASGKIVLGTVQGDMHDIGKNLVSMLMEGAGFTVIDLGTDVSPQKFVEAVRENSATFVGLSALLTTTMPRMKDTIDALKEAGIRDQIKIMVGGAPVTAEFAQQIGADAYAPDGGSAVKTAKELR